MAFPFIPLAIAGISTWASSAYLNRRAMESPDYVPRIDGMQSDARFWGLGMGILGLLLGPAMPLLGSIGIGMGVGSLVNYDTMAKVKAGLAQFASQQGLASPLALPGPSSVLPSWMAPLFEGEAVEAPGAY